MIGLALGYSPGVAGTASRHGRQQSAGIALWGVLITVLIASFGGIWSLAQSVAEVNNKLDRNCGYLRDISIGLQLHEVERQSAGARIHAVPTLFPSIRC